MSKPHSTLTQAIVKELLDYDLETGILTWKPRPDDKRWTVRHSGKEAGVGRKMKEKYYRELCIYHDTYKAHRIIWLYQYGEFPANEIDHINGNGLDNRIVNLRAVTTAENAKNQLRYKNNLSGVTGICWSARKSRWIAQIGLEGKVLHLGTFGDFFDAVCVRKSAERNYGFHQNHGNRKN